MSKLHGVEAVRGEDVASAVKTTEGDGRGGDGDGEPDGLLLL